MTERISVEFDLAERAIRFEVACHWWRGYAETFSRAVRHDDDAAILEALREALAGRVLADGWERAGEHRRGD